MKKIITTGTLLVCCSFFMHAQFSVNRFSSTKNYYEQRASHQQYIYKAALVSANSTTWDSITYIFYGNLVQKSSNTHDNGKLKTETVSIVNATGNLTKNLKSTYNYNAQNLLSRLVNKQHDASSNSWINSSKIEFNYTSTNTIDSVKGTNWINNAWQNEYLNVLYYNANGNQDSLLGFYWNSFNNTYEPDFKERYTYNASNVRIENVGLTFDNTLSTYLKNYRDTLLVNPNFHKVWLTQSWDGTAFVNEFKVEHFYDAVGNPSEITNYVWQAEQWVNNERENLICDINYTHTDIDFGYNFLPQDYAQHAVKHVTVGDWDGIGFNTYLDVQLYYSKTNVGIAEEKVNTFSVYPNPASNKVIFEGVVKNNATTKLSMYNLIGEKVRQKTFNNKTEFSVKNLSPGVYLYQLTQGISIETGKLKVF